MLFASCIKHSFKALCLVQFCCLRGIGISELPRLYPRAVATFLFSFSEADIRHGVLFFNAPEHVLQNVQAYTMDELCMVGASWLGPGCQGRPVMDRFSQVGRAYGHFQMAHTPLFECISEALPQHTLAIEAELFCLLRCLKVVHGSSDLESFFNFSRQIVHRKFQHRMRTQRRLRAKLATFVLLYVIERC